MQKKEKEGEEKKKKDKKEGEGKKKKLGRKERSEVASGTALGQFHLC